MNLAEIKKKYNKGNFRKQGINTDKVHRHSVVFSDAENDKMLLVLKSHNLTISDFIRYASHYFADHLSNSK